jgi:hypothetical protein
MNLSFYKKVKNTLTPKKKVSAEAIHAEYEAAADRIINPILRKDTEYEQGVIASKMGFSRSKVLIRAGEDEIKSAHLTDYYKEQAEKARMNFPHYKYITKEAAETINKKYGLVSAPGRFYTGDIPTKNLQEMQAFLEVRDAQIKKEETAFREWYDTATADQRQHSYFESSLQQSPFISAPLSEFDKDAMNRENMRIQLGETIYYAHDPIVLQPYEGGFLIVSKWGEEASDPMLVNEIEN